MYSPPAKPAIDETQVFTIRPALTPEPKQTASTLDFHLDELSTRPGTELPPLVSGITG